MRTPKVFLVGLLVAGLAGCGTAAAGEIPSGVWVPASESPSAFPFVSPTGDSSGEPSEESSEEPSVDPATEMPDVTPSASVQPTPSVRPGRPGSGPAESLQKTGTAGVALTFDDGPDPVQTPRLLDLLAEHHVKATFCVVGENVAAHPDLVRRIFDEGHTLCNHTWRHSLTLGKESPEAIRADLQRTNDAIQQAVPAAEINYMRAPGGNFTTSFVAVAAELGMTSIYWQVDPRDWDRPVGETAEQHVAKIVDKVKAHVSKGAIVLSHDHQQPDTITAYEELIPWLKARYRLIALR